jgi:hypothetical protein
VHAFRDERAVLEQRVAELRAELVCAEREERELLAEHRRLEADASRLEARLREAGLGAGERGATRDRVGVARLLLARLRVALIPIHFAWDPRIRTRRDEAMVVPMISELRSTVHELEKRVVTAQSRADSARAAVERAQQRRDELERLVMDGAHAPLPLAPLLGSLAALLGALMFAFWVYGVWKPCWRCATRDECDVAASLGGGCLGDIWDQIALMFGGPILILGGLVVSRRRGAGGSARTLLARVAGVVSVLALLALLVHEL